MCAHERSPLESVPIHQLENMQTPCKWQLVELAFDYFNFSIQFSRVYVPFFFTGVCVCVLLATFLIIQYSPKKKVKEKWTKHRRPTAKESETKCCYGENLIRIRSEISHIFVVIESIEAQSDKTYIESFATHTFVPGTEAVIQFQLITMADRNAISCSYSRHIFSLKWFHLWAFGGYWVRASNLV